GATLAAVKEMRGRVEVLVVDGGSSDGTTDILRAHGVLIVESERGRGQQMHVGARRARGHVLWFLHADTIPPADAAERIGAALSDTRVLGGNCRVRFDGERAAAHCLTWLYPQLRKIGLCYGDSGIFVRRASYDRAGGFKP